MPLSAEDARTLGQLRVQQRLSLPTLCELTFFDPIGPLGGASTTIPGSALRVMVQRYQDPLFVGQITAVEYAYTPSHERIVRVRGYDLLHQLRKRQPVRVHVQVTFADLAHDLVADLGIVVEASEPGPLWQRLIQHRQSDLDLLGEVAERCGLYFTLRDTTLHAVTLEGIGDEIPLVLGESLLETCIEINGDLACRSVSTMAWDPLRVEPHQGRAAIARVGRNIPTEVPPARVGGTGERTLVDEVAQTDLQAEAMAQAALDFQIAQEVTLWGVAAGDPRLRPGTPVQIQGVAPPVVGRYVLTSVNHTIDNDKGFLSELSTSPPMPHMRTRSAFTAFGIVTRVDDPDGQGRVQVSLPSYNNVETGWMGVLTPGAGTGKGLVSLPDVGDQVLVLFAHGDPAQGIILGGLCGQQVPLDWGVEGGTIRRYTFATPGGQRVRLDDARNAIRLENSQGSYLELSPTKVTISAQGDLEIEAPGHTVVIRGQAIDFERG
jgi:phage baseplate assembly protein gpV/phage protein D